MTRSDWLACNDPSLMLKAVEGSSGSRKLRLFSCACSRHVPQFLGADVNLLTIETTERYTDGLGTFAHLCAVLSEAGDFGNRWRCAFPSVGRIEQVRAAVTEASRDRRAERHYQCVLLRDLFSHLFCRLPPPPEAIVPLAERIYAGEWNLIPLLGESLQEHGYWSEGEHCLDSNNQHVKGCWVVDWVTGRE